jgi:hypothetical protein
VTLTVAGRLRALAISGIFCMGLGGLLLHAKIHWIFSGDQLLPTNLIPLVATLVSVIAVTALFATGKHSAEAQLLNGMTAVIGIVVMTHYMLALSAGDYQLSVLVLQGTLADSLILIGKWALGQMLFEIDADRQAGRALKDIGKRPAWWRYLRPGWWLIHLLAMAAVYTVGVQLF